MKWSFKQFPELSTDELYDILRLRQNVFVVEQECPYPDADGEDQQWRHLLAHDKGKLVAYARIGNEKDGSARIGRVVVDPDYRGQGLGRELMEKAIHHAHELAPKQPVYVGAQTYLLEFYNSLGFESVGEAYLEDGIPHQGMQRLP